MTSARSCLLVINVIDNFLLWINNLVQTIHVFFFVKWLLKQTNYFVQHFLEYVNLKTSKHWEQLQQITEISNELVQQKSSNRNKKFFKRQKIKFIKHNLFETRKIYSYEKQQSHWIIGAMMSVLKRAFSVCVLLLCLFIVTKISILAISVFF